VHKLSIPLPQVTAEGIRIHAVVSAEELRPESAKGLALGPVTIKGCLSEMRAEYLFQGRVSGTYRHSCDRCLDAVEQPFDLEVMWAFSQGRQRDPLGESEANADEPDAGFSTFEGEAIDLRPQVWEEIALAAPTKYLCKEDCAGLCPRCGANLNRESCSCVQTDSMANTGLAGLADLFPDLTPRRSEDSDCAGTQT